MALSPLERTRFLYAWCPVARKDAQPICKCRRSSKWKSYRIRSNLLRIVPTDSLRSTGMPERDYQPEERLEALLRFSAPGEFGNLFHDVEPTKTPLTIRAGRRRKNPRSGGVLFPRDSKASWAVNIRPKNWGNRDKIWMGKIKSVEEAQRIADIVYHYIGSASVHFLFPGVRERPPPFLNSKLQVLDSVEKRMRYVKCIAKGDQFLAERKEFMDSVKEMVKYLVAREEVKDEFIASDSVLDTLLATTCSIRSPDLAVATFDEAYGNRGLSSEIPYFHQDEIDSMMNILLPDYAF